MRNQSLIDRIADTFGWSIGIALLAMIWAGVVSNFTRPKVQITLGSTNFTLEIANTPTTQSRGLMKRTAKQLKKGGMIFPVKPRRKVVIWMKDMLVSLDIVFISQGKIVKILHQVPPCQADFYCLPIASPGEVDAVIELLGGRAQNVGLREGIKFNLPNNY